MTFFYFPVVLFDFSIKDGRRFNVVNYGPLFMLLQPKEHHNSICEEDGFRHSVVDKRFRAFVPWLYVFRPCLKFEWR